jgi:hypothetical protein
MSTSKVSKTSSDDQDKKSEKLIIIFAFSLIDHLGWQGAFLVTAAIVLVSVFFGALFKPLENSPVK